MVEQTYPVLSDRLERERFQLAIEAAHLGTWEADLATEIVTVSARAAEILGLPERRDLTLGMWRDILHPEDRERVYSAYMGAATARSPYREQYRLLLPDGGLRWVVASGTFVSEDERRSPTAIGIIEDITDRKLAEEALVRKTQELAESEAQYRTMGEAIPYGVWLCDANGGARYVSPSFLELLEMSQEEQSEFGWTKRYDPNTVKAMMDRWMYCIRTGELWEYEHRILGPDKEYHTVLSRGRPVRDTDGKITSWVGVNLDITDRKRAELEVAQKKAELEVAIAQIRELDEAKSRFFANVSHELRTPLALILGPIDELLANAALPAEQRHDLEVVRRNAQTLLAYVNDLLDLSRLDAKRLQIDYSEADLARVVRFVADHFMSASAQRGIALNLIVPEALEAEVDAPKIGRVMFNLMSNAFKHVSDRRGRVEVTAKAGDGHAVIEVADNGPGIPAGMRERIFQRFVQGDDPHRSAGTGLGLAIAQEFVGLHGGTIAVDEAPSGGALFRVVLPLKAPVGTPVAKIGEAIGGLVVTPAAEAKGLVDAQPTDSRTEADLPLVLVVEDNADLQGFVAKTLRGIARVATADDGVDGLAAAERLQPDLVLTDIMMPHMSGDRMVAEMRARQTLANIPVMVLSARADEPLRIRLLRGQAQDYLVKPFAADELQARVANLLQVKRARDLLRAELSSSQENLEILARDIAALNRRLRASADEMRIARDRAEEASKAKSAFLNMMSHELRTPLTQLELQLALLRYQFGGTLDVRQNETLSAVSAAWHRLAQLVGSVLEFSRIESGRLKVLPESVNLPELVSEACQEVGDEAKRRNLELAVDSRGDAPPLITDPALVRLVVHNLLDNAIKFTPLGKVSVSVAAKDGGQQIMVSDTGPGIPVDAQDRIFEPFEQLEDVDRKHTPGVGLGLALVKELTAALGGHVAVKSSPGSGSTFIVDLPSMQGGT